MIMPDYTDDYPDMTEPAYIVFENNGSGEFAFGCVAGQIFGGGDNRLHRLLMDRKRRNGRSPGRRLGRTPA
jgi:hypothetical protein